ncbi:MAG: NADH-quinone oxidoreductase subunit NuoK [Gammaproteobacteria bacterium]|nr:NADH-quinone oxidoreductase subunit NuoK [Gammaproteobacteria bacterium]
MLSLTHFMLLSGALFAIGVAGVFVNRRHALVLLMSLELILLAVNTNFIAASHYLQDLGGQAFALFVLTIAAAEIAIGLAIVVVVFRSRETIDAEDLSEVRG